MAEINITETIVQITAADPEGAVAVSGETVVRVVEVSAAGAETDPIWGAEKADYALLTDLNTKADDADLSAHISNTSNPHVVTKTQVGLGNVDNTSDVNKPVSTATQTALNAKQDSLGFTPENSANKGQANGYASLDVSGQVPAAQLPSYVDDVLEYNELASFPVSGDTGKIYVAKDTEKVYRWSGSAYIEISPSPGSTDSVTEGSTNKYFTEARVLATILNGLSLVSGIAITASDSVLSAFGKLQKQITDILAVTSGVNTGDQDLSGLQPLDAGLTALAELNSDGFLTRVAEDTFASRMIAAGDNSITVVNGNGVDDDPTIAVTPGEKRVIFFEDFIATQLLVAGTSGTAGAANSATATAGDLTHVGIMTQSTGTDAAGRASLQFQNNAFRFGGGTYIMEVLSQIPTLSDGTDIFTVRIGFGDTAGGESRDAIFFRYTHSVNSGKFQAVTRAANVETGSATDTGVTAVAGTWYKFKVEVSSNGAFVDFYINDTYVATNTTNIPLGVGNETGGIMSIIKGGGTAARTLLHDWVKLDILLTTSR